MAERPVPVPAAMDPERPASPVIATTEYHVLRQIAADLIASGYLPKSIQRPEQAVAIVMLGRELGMGPWQAINAIDVIQGRPTLNARGMLSLVKRFVEPRGGWFRIVEATPERATVEYYRPPEPEPRRVVYTLEEARQAGLLGKDSWKQYPLDMLRNRAIVRACREGFPDVILGLYTPEEMETAEHVAAPVRVIEDLPQPERPSPGEPATAGPPAGTRPAGSPTASETRPPEQPAPVSTAMRALHAAAKGKASHKELSALARHVWGVPSMRDLGPGELAALREAVAECADGADAAVLLQLAATVDEATTPIALQGAGAAIAAAKDRLGDGARIRLLRAAYARVREAIEAQPEEQLQAQIEELGETTWAEQAGDGEEETVSWTALWRQTGETLGVRSLAEAARYLGVPERELRGLTPAEVQRRLAER